MRFGVRFRSQAKLPGLPSSGQFVVLGFWSHLKEPCGIVLWNSVTCSSPCIRVFRFGGLGLHCFHYLNPEEPTFLRTYKEIIIRNPIKVGFTGLR